MKTLIIAPFLDGTGYGRAAIDVAQALSEHTDVMCRPLKLNQALHEPSEKMKKLLETTFDPDVVLQICTPNFMVGPGIGWWFQESKNQGKRAGWHRNLSYMTQWVSGPFKTERNMVVPTDITKYQKEYAKPLKDNGKFRFYYIGDVSRRKNVEGIIKAFLLAFQRQEVELFLKVPLNQVQTVQKMCEDLITGSRMNQRHLCTINIDGSNYTDEQIYGLHQQCHCFVTLARGEGWCLPAIDAMGFQKRMILPDYMNNIGDGEIYRTMYSVKSVESPCWLSDSMPKIYNSTETWWEPDVLDAAKQMKAAFDSHTKQLMEMWWNGQLGLSYDKVGPKILEALNDFREANS